MRKNKTWTVNLFDRLSVLGTSSVGQGQNDEFWTNDTEAYLNFKPNNDSFEFIEAELTMYNKNDGSLVVLDSTDGVEIENNVVSYEMQPEVIAHFGKWTVQVRFIRADNESFTSGIIEYEVKRALGDAIPEKLSAIKNWDTFFAHAQETIDLIGEAETQREVEFGDWLEYAYSLNPGDGSGVDLSSYATKNYVDTAVSNVPIPDLSDYALKSHTHSEYALSSALANYVTNNQAQSTYATKQELANAQLGGDVDLTGYATEGYVNNAINDIPLPDLSDYSKIGHTHSEYALKSQVKTDVPANAKFTDTTYTAGTGINISGDVISATGGGEGGYDDTSVVNHMNDRTNPHDVTKSQVGLGNVDDLKQASKAEFDTHDGNTTRHITSAERLAWNAKQNALGFTPENVSNKGKANGYAGLDGTGRVPVSQLPDFEGGDSSVEVEQARVDANGVTKTTLKQRLDDDYTEVTSQLAETKQSFNDAVNKVTVDSEVILARDGKTTLGVRLDEIEAGEGLAPKSVTLDKMEVIPAPGIRRINLFNKEKYTPNSVIGRTTGIVSPNPYPEYPFAVSDFISIEPNQEYYTGAGDTWVMFDGNRNWLAGDLKNVIPGHPNGAYVRFVFQETDKDTVMLVKGNTAPAEYEPYGVKLDTNLLDDKSIPESKLADKFLKLSPSKNLFNKDAVEIGKYVEYSTGTLKTQPTYSASEFIPIEPDKDYTKTDSQQLAFYDISKNFTSGIASAQTFKTPENAHFLRLSVSNHLLSTYQLEEGTVSTNYKKYGHYIPMESLEPSLAETLTLSSEFKIILPDEIYTVTDEEYNIYFRNVFSNNLNLENYDVIIKEVDGVDYKQIGRHIDYKWFYTPTSAGQKTIEIRLIDSLTFEVKASKRLKLVISDKTLSSVSSPNIITIGDSFVENWGVTKNIYEMMATDANNQPNFLGLHDAGVDGVKHDAWAGYGYAWYYGNANGYKRNNRTDGTETSTPNQFYNPATSKFDFSYYMSTYQSNASVDIVQCLLGINDSLLRPYAELSGYSLNSLLNKIEEMWNSILSYDSTIKILPILITPLNGLNDGFITGYAGLWNGAKSSMRKVEMFNLGMLEKFGTQAWRDKGVHLIAVNANWDYRYAIRSETIKPVKFDQSIEEVHTFDIHPNLEIGSKYIADSMRNAVRYFQA